MFGNLFSVSWPVGRATVHLPQLNHRAAKSDLEMYLRLEPNSPEREQVEKQLVLIERWKAGLN